MAGPPAQVAEQEALGHAPSQRSGGLDVGESESAPETDGGEAIGHAAAEGDGVAVRVLVVDEVEGEDARAVAVFFGSLGVGVGGEFGVEELQVLDGEGAAVVVHLRIAGRAVVGPALAAVECVQVVHVGEDAVLRVCGAVGFEAQVGEDAKP